MRWAIISNGSSYITKGNKFNPVTFLMEYFLRIRSLSSLSFRISSLISMILFRNGVWFFSNVVRLSGSPVFNRVPSASTIFAESNSLSLLACVPQFIPDALFMTIPPTIADFTDAGSGANLRPWGFNISLTRAPIIPGWSVMRSKSSEMEYFSQFFPATISIESLIL